MQHPDEGMIHAWIDGALDSEAARELEAHLAECQDCARVAAEARGLVAAASRILTALDNVPGDVIPISGAAVAKQRRVSRIMATPLWARTAASVLIVAGVSALLMTGKLNKPETKRADMVAARSQPQETAPLNLDTLAAAPPAKDAGAIAAREQSFSDKLAREERIAEADQAQKSLEKKATVAAVQPTEPARRDAAANTAADVRGVLSGAETAAGKAVIGSVRGGQGAAAPSMTAPTAQSMAAPSAMRRELLSTSARVRAATGCFALTLSPWSGGTIPFGAPPARIELDSLTSVQESIRGLHLVHPARGAASNGAPLAYWRAFGDSAFVTWRDDLRGVTLTLPLSGEVVQGSARTFSTSARDGAAQTAEVEARRISCRE